MHTNAVSTLRDPVTTTFDLLTSWSVQLEVLSIEYTCIPIHIHKITDATDHPIKLTYPISPAWVTSRVKPAFHDADTDTEFLTRIFADTSDTRDFLKLFLWQAERHADILATILARMSVSVSASWNASFTL